MRTASSIAAAVLIAACGGATTLPSADHAGDGGGDGGTADDSAVVSAPGTPCSVEGVTGSVPGVTISIRSDKCVYRVGEPAKFTYEVTVDDRLPPIVIAASQGCGSCRTAADDPSAFIGYDIDGTSGGGQPQHYCVCDVGCCAPDQAQTIKLTPATRTGVIEWSGRNWMGPSDTGNQEGAFFPPGSYAVHVGFANEVSATLPIQLVP